MADLDNLTAEQLQTLRQQLGLLSGSDVPFGCSPQFSKGTLPGNPRQLMDLTLPPTKDDPRPTFFWSAEPPRANYDIKKTTPYPRLMWDGATGREITVKDATAEQTMTAKGFILTRPGNAEEPDLKAQVDAALAQLSEADRAMLIEAAQQDKLSKIRTLMAGLSQEDLAALRGDVVAAVGDDPPVRRGPGRPRKEESV